MNTEATPDNVGCNEGLGPCPCCGGAARFQQEQRPENAGGWYVECTNRACGITTQLRFPLMEDVKPLLRETWNRRAGRRIRLGVEVHVAGHMEAWFMDEDAAEEWAETNCRQGYVMVRA